MADKPQIEIHSYEPAPARSLSVNIDRKPSGSKLAAPDTWQQRESRKSSKLSGLLSPADMGLGRTVSALSIDPRRGSEGGYDSDDDENREIGLEERLARDRINHLHEVFLSAQGSEGLSMQEFRAAMRQVMLTESGRRMEDDELDKVFFNYPSRTVSGVFRGGGCIQSIGEKGRRPFLLLTGCIFNQVKFLHKNLTK